MSIDVERHGAAALVILNTPENRNAIGPDVAEALAAKLVEVAKDAEVKGVVITGAGGIFSGGGDIKGMAQRINMPAEERRKLVYSRYQGLIRTILSLPVPTVAAIDGVAVGLGLDVAMACDSRFVGPQGWCRQGWGKLGLIAGTGGVLLMRHRAPGLIWSALESGKTFDAAAMVAVGLAEGTDGDTARNRALKRIELYGHMQRSTLEAYVGLERAQIKAELETHLKLVLDYQMPLLTASDFGDRLAKARS